MKLDRLVSIITVLLRRERVSARELADMFEVSVRTILRDVDAINLSGIPIVTWQGAGGGIGIAEGYKLDRSVLTGDEMATLITSLSSVASSMDDPRLGILIDKIKNVIPQSQRTAIELKTSQIVIDMSPWGGNWRLKNALETIRCAIEEQREISFLYIDTDNQRTERTVQPYTLILKGQNWYLHGWCMLRGAFRLFKLIRMRDTRCLDTRFIRMEGSKALPLPEPGAEEARTPSEMLLAFNASAENAVLEWFGDGDIEQKDGRFIVRSNMPENKWLYGFLLSFGPALEILEPPRLRDIIKKLALETYRKYQDD